MPQRQIQLDQYGNPVYVETSQQQEDIQYDELGNPITNSGK